ncbi:MAG: ABC transporter substrate-binding protein [Eubacteriales bacterium]|nr:ABC transporter substrate-binding protein [Eubacteriales bacterium]
MKKTIPFLLALAMTAALTGCSGSKSADTTTAAAAETITAAAESADKAADADTKTEGDAEAAESKADGETEAAESKADGETEAAADGQAADQTSVRVGSLKGPTSMGLVHLMDEASAGNAANAYEFTMVTAADELLGKVVSGDLDIALVPANVASVLYNKTKGGISVIDINTLGVLDIVASDDSITSIADLKGKTVYMTGKGTTPDYVFHYLLTANGLTENDVTIEFKSEPTEVAAVLKEQPDAIGLLPQPFVTAACAQNEALKIVLDLTNEWQAVQGESGSQMVTGVTVARNEFLKSSPDAVKLFLQEHAASAEYTETNPDETAELIAAKEIVAKAPIAKKALPYCNITCLTGEDMKAALSGYLQVLFDQNPASVGGRLPEDGFYYMP